ncbi:MAG: hypothetical protein M3Z33_01935 [Actinomycetota bacterium]|nr:hypothetical protein [Actinomycetota bacterium]
MRSAVLLAAVPLILLGCGSEKTKTVTVRQPPTAVTAPPATSTPSSTTTDPGAAYRKPKPGEDEVTILGRVSTGRTVKGSGSGDTSVLTAFAIQPDDGGRPLRVGAAGDLDLSPKIRTALVDARCGGKLHGTFVVIGAGRPASDYDWELLRADVPSPTCGGP